jgi:hypothetical protein
MSDDATLLLGKANDSTASFTHVRVLAGSTAMPSRPDRNAATAPRSALTANDKGSIVA